MNLGIIIINNMRSVRGYVCVSEFLRVCTVFRCNVYLDQYLFLIFANGPHTAQFLFTSFYFRFIVRIPFNITLLTSLDDDDDDHVARRTAGVSLDLIIFVLIFFCVLLSFLFLSIISDDFFPFILLFQMYCCQRDRTQLLFWYI